MQKDTRYNNKNWLEEQYSTLQKSGVQIAKEFNLNEDLVYAYLKKFKIKMRQRNSFKRTNFQTPENFINIKTPEAAYILGLIWADGSINITKRKFRDSYRITLTNREVDAVYYTPIFKKTGNWNCCRKLTDYSPILCFDATNEILVKFLIENDYKSKSWESADKILSKIPEHLKHYWFRGLVDGDGTIVNWKKRYTTTHFSICSGHKQDWTYMKELCNRLNINYKIYKTQNEKGRASYFRMCGRENIINICNYIYQNYENDKIGLPRKYLKFKEIENEENAYKKQLYTKRLTNGIHENKSKNGKFYIQILIDNKLIWKGKFKTFNDAVDFKKELVLKERGELGFEKYFGFKYINNS